MNWRDRLGVAGTRLRYTKPIVGDTPRNGWLLACSHGTWRKFLNYWRVRRDYRGRRTHVSGRPYAIRVDPITACNLRCPLCPTGAGETDRRREVMSPELFARVLDDFGQHALIVHFWIWGEPLLNARLAELVRLARQRGIATEVSTHLSVRLSEAQIDALITAGLSWLIVSADAATADTYSQYRRGGDFDLVVGNLRRIVERRRALGSRTPFLEWQFVPLRHNEREMAAAAALARSVGVDGMRYKPARVDKIANLTFAGDVPAALIEQWMPADGRLAHVLPPGGAFHERHCPFLWGTVTVHPDGGIAPCCETSSRRHDLAQLADASGPQFWNSPAYVTARTVALGRDTTLAPGLACHGCKVFSKPERPAVS
jgi:MoaA/NifB/PqqE/SkfB family radical SAM enzyme